jgi:hypothetical protein
MTEHETEFEMETENAVAFHSVSILVLVDVSPRWPIIKPKHSGKSTDNAAINRCSTRLHRGSG